MKCESQFQLDRATRQPSAPSWPVACSLAPLLSPLDPPKAGRRVHIPLLRHFRTAPPRPVSLARLGELRDERALQARPHSNGSEPRPSRPSRLSRKSSLSASPASQPVSQSAVDVFHWRARPAVGSFFLSQEQIDNKIQDTLALAGPFSRRRRRRRREQLAGASRPKARSSRLKPNSFSGHLMDSLQRRSPRKPHGIAVAGS